jgi:hypothetical protein
VADSPIGPGLRRLEELAQGGEDLLQVGVVGRHAAFEGGEVAGELGVGAGEVAEVDEGADDEDARFDRARAVQDGRGHDRAVLGERPGPVLDVLSALQGHRS